MWDCYINTDLSCCSAQARLPAYKSLYGTVATMVTAETEGCAGEGLSRTVVAEDLATSVPLMRALTARLATAAALPVAGNSD